MEEKMDLESIASIFHYSRYHLHRMFASVAGFPLHTYLTRRRLTEAARLLVWTDRPGSGNRAGVRIRDAAIIFRAFQKYFQHSPSRYRKRGFFPLQLKYDVFRRGKAAGRQDNYCNHEGSEGTVCRRLLQFHKGRICRNRKVLETASCKKDRISGVRIRNF